MKKKYNGLVSNNVFVFFFPSLYDDNKIHTRGHFRSNDEKWGWMKILISWFNPEKYILHRHAQKKKPVF